MPEDAQLPQGLIGPNAILQLLPVLDQATGREGRDRLLAQAGRRTADYILAHRIPQPAQRLLKHLPAPVAAWALSRAIATHAWTFAGSGQFHRDSPWRFAIANNPLVRGENSSTPRCHWHAAVFGHLYATLVHPSCRCVETECAAQTGNGPCRFTLFRVA
ncbi:bacteriochlorophyll 4-vinyl reductase [Pseudotabrizicola sp. L79]|uniref:bacteriochlorophyll 4-vinyl reductase n=1 Tax=Pseudotabrizicola sp. L79 TaxID=3118402 RepID=UPI002F93F635